MRREIALTKAPLIPKILDHHKVLFDEWAQSKAMARRKSMAYARRAQTRRMMTRP